jgi:mediator of RNA polymerase II transcription subunit 7
VVIRADRKAELKKLNRSILICFLELLDILINNPASPAREQKIKDLSVLFINMHHLINEFRPHQARETLCVIMERQRKQREDMIIQVQRARDKAHSILKECAENLGQAVGSLPPSDPAARQNTSNQDDSMDSNMVPGGSSGIRTGSGGGGASSLVHSQDFELCSLIDQLIGT